MGIYKGERQVKRKIYFSGVCEKTNKVVVGDLIHDKQGETYILVLKENKLLKETAIKVKKTSVILTFDGENRFVYE